MEVQQEITQEQINSWKGKHGDVFKVDIEGYTAYLKKPDRKTLGYVATLANNPIKANETLLENCWLGGDSIIKSNDELFLGVSSKLAEIVQVKQAEIVKL